jgi:hypothetical protein
MNRAEMFDFNNQKSKAGSYIGCMIVIKYSYITDVLVFGSWHHLQMGCNADCFNFKGEETPESRSVTNCNAENCNNFPLIFHSPAP